MRGRSSIAFLLLFLLMAVVAAHSDGLSGGAPVNLASPGPIGGTTPSTGVFTQVTVNPAVNTQAEIVSGFSLTGANAQSVLDLAGTWNTSGTPTGIKLVITDTASNAASKLIDLQDTANGGSVFSVQRDGATNITGGLTGAGATFTNSISLQLSNAIAREVFGGDTEFDRLGAQNMRFGAPPSATPLAQTVTIGEASRVGADTNIGGSSGTFQSGLGTGTGATSSLIFQTPAQVGSGTGSQTQTTRFTIAGSTATAAALVTVAGDFRVTPGTAPTAGACGTSPAITAGSSDTAGEITAGTATPTSCAINFGTTKASAPFCIVVNETNNLAAFTYAVSTTAITVTQTATSSDKIAWHCIQH